ncbi:DNA double-strand break repair protein Mre11 [Thermococcus peptonophilus]|uniref:DNA double-strand break repair protein Mre11 n=1 Tax=Thermococcus peptonophilus TaxID=53952 RepID=A0A142CUJ4_9EURY|nr:DNA double-strand break repair protein Mre11 [Thermococcus peptonophilus]AMQ18446.1 double-stranded DNA repair protein Mre11 [Thermococcus peptonophilus]
MKFAHIADVHLGFEQYRLPYRADEFAEAFRRAIEIAVEKKVDFILIAGDLFHSSRPSPETLKQAMEMLSLPKEKGIPVFGIEGNHDRTQRRVSAYHLLEKLGLLYLIGLREEKVESEHQTSEKTERGWLVKGVFEKGNKSVEIHGMKYMSAAWLEKNPPKEIFRPEGDSILMLHQGVRELVEEMMGKLPESQRDYYELRLGDLPKGYLYYALGHIHRAFLTSYDIGKLAYPGSLQRWDFGDYELRYRWDGNTFKPTAGNPKGFYIVEDWEPRFIELKVRPFIDINIKADEETAKRELKRLSTKIPEEAFVRLDIRWEKPYDVSKLTELIKARYVYVRTRFERKLTGRTPTGEVPKPEEYFIPVELKAINLTGEKAIESIEEVVELFLGEGWDEKLPKKSEEPERKEDAPAKKEGSPGKEKGPKTQGKEQREKKERKDSEKKVIKRPSKGSNLLDWLGGGR